MPAIKHISIKSVLYELSTLIEEEHWDEARFLEWANKAAKKINLFANWEDKVCTRVLDSHRAEMPTDWKFINMILYREDTVDNSTLTDLIARELNLEESTNPAVAHMENVDNLLSAFAEPFSSAHQYKPLRRTSGFFMNMIHCDDEFYSCPECAYEYSISQGGIITSTLQTGILAISYKAYPTDEEGYLLIPDNEDLKEALVHYCLYRHFLRKSIYSEDASRGERDWHLRRYSVLAMKAKSTDLPDIDELENIKNFHTRIVPRTHMYDTYFTMLGNKENNDL